MFSCPCGRQLNSGAALSQHQADKIRFGFDASACRASRTDVLGRANQSFPGNGRRDAWIWKGVRGLKIQTIDLATLEPSASPVSSESASELLCTYNWRDCKEAKIHIPGEHLILLLSSWPC